MVRNKFARASWTRRDGKHITISAIFVAAREWTISQSIIRPSRFLLFHLIISVYRFLSHILDTANLANVSHIHTIHTHNCVPLLARTTSTSTVRRVPLNSNIFAVCLFTQTKREMKKPWKMSTEETFCSRSLLHLIKYIYNRYTCIFVYMIKYRNRKTGKKYRRRQRRRWRIASSPQRIPWASERERRREREGDGGAVYSRTKCRREMNRCRVRCASWAHRQTPIFPVWIPFYFWFSDYFISIRFCAVRTASATAYTHTSEHIFLHSILLLVPLCVCAKPNDPSEHHQRCLCVGCVCARMFRKKQQQRRRIK